jgi:hypothetical protein
MPRHLLVVITTEVEDSKLRDLVRSRDGDDAEMLVVAPASGISWLDRLTNAEDDARTDAALLAVKTADATPTENVEARVGDSDPMQAIEDALRTFAADEILVVVARTDNQDGWLEDGARVAASKRFGLPITRIAIAEDGSPARPRS